MQTRHDCLSAITRLHCPDYKTIGLLYALNIIFVPARRVHQTLDISFLGILYYIISIEEDLLG
jgi:hypothetical protein